MPAGISHKSQRRPTAFLGSRQYSYGQRPRGLTGLSRNMLLAEQFNDLASDFLFSSLGTYFVLASEALDSCFVE